MGFLKTIELNNGLGVSNAYHRINNIFGTKKEITFILTAYKSQDDFLNDVDIEPLVVKPFIFNPDVSNVGENFFKQGYTHLNKLDEYSDMVNILEEGQVL